MKALILVDVQNDFCPGGSLAVSGGDEIVKPINTITDQFDIVVATKDWHPAGHVSFASTHGKTPGELIPRPSGPQMLWPDHCVRGTSGSDFHKDLSREEINLILHKGTRSELDSYSAFYENDRTTSTGLAPYLKGLGITEVTLCGLATDYCVFYSVMDAVREGFAVSLVTDCCRAVGIPDGSEKKALEEMRNAGVKMITSKEIVNV